MLSLLLSVFVSMSAAKEFKQNDYCPLVTVVTHESVTDAINCLKKQKKKKLFVSSPGGSTDAGEILLKFVNKNKITVMCVECYSMAAILWLNADKKELGEGAQLMMHYAWTMLPPETPITIDACTYLANELKRATEALMYNMAPDVKEYFINRMKEGDYWFQQDVIDALQIKYTFISKPKAA